MSEFIEIRQNNVYIAILREREIWDTCVSDLRLCAFYSNGLKGLATQMLFETIRNMDLNGEYLFVLECDPSEDDKLQKFYEKLGFKLLEASTLLMGQSVSQFLGNERIR